MGRINSMLSVAHDQLTYPVRETSRYDLILVAIPLAFVAAGLVGWLAAVPLTVTAGLASVIGIVAMVDAMFLNPPREPSAGPPPA